MKTPSSSSTSPAFRIVAIVVATSVGLAATYAPWPLLAISSVGLGILAWIVAPAALLATLGFLAAAIPKAGIKLGEFPVPALFFGLMAAAVGLLWLNRGHMSPMPNSVILVTTTAVAWLLIRCLWLAGSGVPPVQIISVAAWYIPPILLLAAASKRWSGAVPRPRALWSLGLAVGILAASIFALVQLVGGVRETAVPGVTIAFNDSYDEKPLLIGQGGTTVSKIPSTYQNGNVLGVVTGFFLVYGAVGIVGGSRRSLDWLLIVLPGAATVLSGSRTAVLGVLAGVLAIVIMKGMALRKLALLFGVVLVLLAALASQPRLLQRFSLASLVDPRAAGRTAQWVELAEEHAAWEFIAGPVGWHEASTRLGLTEGLPGAAQQVGLIGVALFVGVFVTVTSHAGLRIWRIPLVVTAVAFAIDSSYLVFPTLFLPAALMLGPAPKESPKRQLSW